MLLGLSGLLKSRGDQELEIGITFENGTDRRASDADQSLQAVEGDPGADQGHSCTRRLQARSAPGGDND